MKNSIFICACLSSLFPHVLSFTGSNLISKSENNLLTPDHRSLWSGETPDVMSTFPTNSFSDTPMNIYRSVPTITVSQTETVNDTPESLSCASSFSDERSHTVSKPAPCEEPRDDVDTNSEVVSSHADVASGKFIKSSGVFEFSKSTTDDCNVTFGQIEFVPLSPLHIDSTLFETGPAVENTRDGSLCFEDESKPVVRSQDCSQLIDALDIQSPVAFRRDTFNRVQSTPYTSRTQTAVSTSLSEEPNASSLSLNTADPQNNTDKPHTSAQGGRKKVSEQIQLFNMMTLNSPKTKVIRSPLKFQRTPVRQSVRRINSLIRDGRTGLVVVSPVTKAVSFESGLCARAKQQTDDPTFIKPPVPPKKPAARHAALDDITNRAPKVKSDTLSANKNTEHPKSVCLHLSESDVTRYRGSPKNPLTEGRLLSATKPIDL